MTLESLHRSMYNSSKHCCRANVRYGRQESVTIIINHNTIHWFFNNNVIIEVKNYDYKLITYFFSGESQKNGLVFTCSEKTKESSYDGVVFSPLLMFVVFLFVNELLQY